MIFSPLTFKQKSHPRLFVSEPEEIVDDGKYDKKRSQNKTSFSPTALKCAECQINISANTFNKNSSKYCIDCWPQPTFLTCWVALGDIDVNDGVIAIMPGTTKLRDFE